MLFRSSKAGVYGMVGGQVVDVEQSGNIPSKEMLQFIFELKTAALLEASMMIGAILAGATEVEILRMEEIAKNIGLAFQIQDDILDITSTTECLGKPVHSDEKNNKTTYVSMYGMDASKRAVEDYSNHAVRLLEECEQKNQFLTTLIQELVGRSK